MYVFFFSSTTVMKLRDWTSLTLKIEDHINYDEIKFTLILIQS